MANKENQMLSDKESIDNLLLDERSLEDVCPAEGFNVFDVLKISRTEIRHSNILAWLLTPMETHGLGIAFLRGFLRNVIAESRDRYSASRFLSNELRDVDVYREWENIDILVVSKAARFVLAIENKIDASEHDNQLSRYRQILCDKYPGYEQMLLFLSPSGVEPSDDNWQVATYASVVSVLEDCLNQMQLPQDRRIFLENYLSTLRKETMTNREEEECCLEIYRRHKQAIDLIMRYVDQDKDSCGEVFARILKEELASRGDDFEFTGDEDGIQNKLSFRTKKMSEALGMHAAGTRGSWNNQSTYYYWIEINKQLGRVRLLLEFGPLNVVGDALQRMESIGHVINPKKSFDGRYRRIWWPDDYCLEDGLGEERIRRWLCACIGEVVRKESEWLKR